MYILRCSCFSQVLCFLLNKKCVFLIILFVLAFAFCLLANDFRIKNDDSEDSELRFITCQSLWNQIKSETEVSLAPHTKAVLCIYNNAACFFVSGDLFSTRLKGQLVKAIKGPEILSETEIPVQNIK